MSNKRRLSNIQQKVDNLSGAKYDLESDYLELKNWLDWHYDLQPQATANLLLAWADDLRPYFVDKPLTFDIVLSIARIYPDTVQLNDLLSPSIVIDDKEEGNENWISDLHVTLLDAIDGVLDAKYKWQLDPATSQRLRDESGFLLPAIPRDEYPQVYHNFTEPTNASWLYRQAAYMPSQFAPESVEKFIQYAESRFDRRVQAFRNVDILELAQSLLSPRQAPRNPLLHL